MNTETRQYKDVAGNPVTLDWLVKNEPEWAANQIRHRDTLEAELRQERLDRAAACATLTKDCNLRGEIIRELRKDGERLDAAAQLQVNMEIVENCAGNIERYMVALNRHNLDKLICERVAEPANIKAEPPPVSGGEAQRKQSNE